jgi:hypothetical protein
MAVTMQQVRAELDPHEPGYHQAAHALGPDALPHLEQIIRQSDAGSASRAVYLASLIEDERSAAVVAIGIERPEATVRVAVAAGARNLAPQLRATLLLRLLDEDDIGVRKVALRAVPAQPEPALMARLEALALTEPEPALRSLVLEKLDQSA